jgi:hypothetical protein
MFDSALWQKEKQQQQQQQKLTTKPQHEGNNK